MHRTVSRIVVGRYLPERGNQTVVLRLWINYQYYYKNSIVIKLSPTPNTTNKKDFLNEHRRKVLNRVAMTDTQTCVLCSDNFIVNNKSIECNYYIELSMTLKFYFAHNTRNSSITKNEVKQNINSSKFQGANVAECNDKESCKKLHDVCAVTFTQ